MIRHSVAAVLAVMALGGAQGDEVGYSDEFVMTGDVSVRRIDVGENEIVYVFTNATMPEVTVTLRKNLQLQRTLVVGGGGAGGWTLGGGGGAGGVLTSAPAIIMAAGKPLTLTVGAGGDPLYESGTGTSWLKGGPGGNSRLAYLETRLEAFGGGGGAAWSATSPNLSLTLASTGGCAGNNRSNSGAARPQGNYGGKSIKDAAATGQYDYGGGGGGGQGSPGGDSGLEHAGYGGLGITNDITGVEVEYAAGGGGGAGNGVKGLGLAGGISAGNGGKAAGAGGPTEGDPAPDGFGGGGGGGGYSPAKHGGAGGAGTVILRFSKKLDGFFALTTSVTGSGAMTVDGAAPEAGAQYPAGAQVRLVATPQSGFRFGYWSGVNDKIVEGNKTSSEVVVELLNDTAVTANFLPEGADYVAFADGKLRLLVDVAAETAASDWLQARTPALTDLSAFDEIVKSGAGILTVADSAFATVLGDVVIRAGRVKTSVADPLGSALYGKVVVESNATLHVVSPTATAVSFGQKPVYFAGNGDDGKGAIWEEQQADGNNSGQPKVQYLTGDALVSWNRRTNLPGSIDIHLEGHTLTFTGSASQYDTWNPSIYDSTESGHLVLKGNKTCVLFANKQNFMFGTAANTLTIAGGQFLRTHNSVVDKPWTLIMEDGSWLQPAGPSTWAGPVVLKGHHRFTRQSGFYWTLQTFSGPISGPGGLGAPNNMDQAGFVLDSLENTFAGGVYLKENVLTLGGNGSLPADGAAFTNFNGTLKFKASQPFHDLPEAYFSGTGQVFCTAGEARTVGAWRNRMIKDGSGELTYDVLVGSPKLVVRGGGLYLPFGADETDLPAFTNVQVRSGAYVRFADGFDGNWTIPELVNGGGEIRSDVTVEKSLTVTDDLTSGETLRVDGTLTFADGAVVSVPDTVTHRGHHTYVLATAKAIVGAPTKTDSTKWTLRKTENADGTESLCVDYAVGLMLFVR